MKTILIQKGTELRFEDDYYTVTGINDGGLVYLESDEEKEERALTCREIAHELKAADPYGYNYEVYWNE